MELKCVFTPRRVSQVSEVSRHGNQIGLNLQVHLAVQVGFDYLTRTRTHTHTFRRLLVRSPEDSDFEVSLKEYDSDSIHSIIF